MVQAPPPASIRGALNLAVGDHAVGVRGGSLPARVGLGRDRGLGLGLRDPRLHLKTIRSTNCDLSRLELCADLIRSSRAYLRRWHCPDRVCGIVFGDDLPARQDGWIRAMLSRRRLWPVVKCSLGEPTMPSRA
jgi:hypothetical protein